MKTLKLFNAVISKNSNNAEIVDVENGLIITKDAAWAVGKVKFFYNKQRMSGNDFNKSFHKSWAKIKNTSRIELLVEQIRHYISTYGSDFADEIYIPAESLNATEGLWFKYIRGYSREELITKCLDMFASGIAMKQETIEDVFSALFELDYQFTGDEEIKNKEAIMYLADNYNIFPKNNVEVLRYVIYKATGKTLLIKDKETIQGIKISGFNPEKIFNRYGLEKLAEIFNRFKPIFLAFKNKCPKTINKISRLSKTKHKPMPINALNIVTNSYVREDSIKNATTFAIFKAISALHERLNGSDVFNYQIRNGKSWVAEKIWHEDEVVLWENNMELLQEIIFDRYIDKFANKKVYIPENVEYTLPTSEKMFVGNIPTGTIFSGERLAVGIYWENSWGARDIDISGIMLGGQKVGWNSAYSHSSLLYSGDITNAPNGAVEYLHASSGYNEPGILKTNIFSGDDNAKYKIVFGEGADIDVPYMMDPNKVFGEVITNSVQKQTVIGLFTGNGKIVNFTVLNFGSGHARVSEYNKYTANRVNALIQKWSHPYTLRMILEVLEVKFVDSPEKADIDLSLNKIEKDTFMKMWYK